MMKYLSDTDNMTVEKFVSLSVSLNMHHVEPHELPVLITLRDAAEGMTMKQLADVLEYAPSSTTVLVTLWVNAGIVTRFTPETDRRSVFVRLSEKGKDFIQQIEAALNA